MFNLTCHCFTYMLQSLFRISSHWLLNMFQHVDILGNWSSRTVALMQGDSSFLFESSTNGTVFHKMQLMPALWTGARTSWTGSGTAGWVSLWTHSPRDPTWLYNAPIQYQTWHRQLQQTLVQHCSCCTRWAIYILDVYILATRSAHLNK